MDFVADQLFDGQKIRAFTAVDNFGGQCLAINVGQTIKGEDVMAVMNKLKIVNLAVPIGFKSITVLSGPPSGLFPKHWTNGVMITVLHSTFQGLENQQIIHLLSLLMVASGMSV